MAGKPRQCEVVLTQGAEQDPESIHDYIAEFDSLASANHVLDRLMEVVDGQAGRRFTIPLEKAVTHHVAIRGPLDIPAR
jgi:plasmid stabilization system protein ParE